MCVYVCACNCECVCVYLCVSGCFHIQPALRAAQFCFGKVAHDGPERWTGPCFCVCVCVSLFWGVYGVPSPKPFSTVTRGSRALRPIGFTGLVWVKPIRVHWHTAHFPVLSQSQTSMPLAVWADCMCACVCICMCVCVCAAGIQSRLLTGDTGSARG